MKRRKMQVKSENGRRLFFGEEVVVKKQGRSSQKAAVGFG
jgi:hypothetical protein